MKITLPETKLSGIISISKGTDPNNMIHISTFPNMILDSGLLEFAKSKAFISYCNVGSSGAAVAASQTTLVNKLRHATELVGLEQTGANNTVVDKYVYRRRTIRFDPTGSAYNVAEIGFGWNNLGALFNRALVLDGGGVPTVISVQSNEYLDVTYELRLYPPLVDTTGTVTPTGKDTTPRTWIARASGEDNLKYGTTGGGWSAQGDYTKLNPGYGVGEKSYTGGIGVIFGVPSGMINESHNGGSTVNDPIFPKAVVTIKLELAKSNNVLGVKSISTRTYGTDYQIEFSSPFMKTNEDELSISYLISWGRK